MLSVLIEQNALLGLVLFPSSSIQHLPITFAQTTSHYPTIQIKHHLSYVVKGTQKHVTPLPEIKAETAVITESQVVFEDTLQFLSFSYWLLYTEG